MSFSSKPESKTGPINFRAVQIFSFSQMSTPHRSAAVAIVGHSADQSRPTPTPPKDVGFFSKHLIKLRSSTIITTSNTIPGTSDESHCMNAPLVATLPRKSNKVRVARRRQVPQPTLVSSFMDDNNVMSWLETECPHDLLPRVLAFAGPQKTAALSRTCRFWRDVVDKESTWKTMCEEMYKVCFLIIA